MIVAIRLRPNPSVLRAAMVVTQGEPQEVTRLLLAWNDGDESALEKLVPLIYQELRRLAKRQMQRERPDHSLQTTALINEAYLRLVDLRNVNWQNRAHFFALCARLMRRILVDFARSRHYAKRGGGSTAGFSGSIVGGLTGALDRLGGGGRCA
jgi:RNA polymerase sigma factor (TIGR02999 family)